VSALHAVLLAGNVVAWGVVAVIIARMYRR
jgi:hypothetical protein